MERRERGHGLRGGVQAPVQAAHGRKLLFADASGTPLALAGVVRGDVASANMWNEPWQRAPSADSDWHVQGWRYDSEPELEVRFAAPLSGDLRIYWTKDVAADSTEEVGMPLAEIQLVRIGDVSGPDQASTVALADVAVAGRTDLDLETPLSADDVVTLYGSLTFTNALPEGESRVVALGQHWTAGVRLGLTEAGYYDQHPEQHRVARLRRSTGRTSRCRPAAPGGSSTAPGCRPGRRTA